MNTTDQYCPYCCLEKGRSGGCEFCGAEADGREVESHHLYLSPGTILDNKYLIGRVLGHGGFGITYLGLDLNLQMRVAIKEHLPRDLATRHKDGSTVIPYSEQEADSYIYGMNKFIEEGRTLARFADHPNIVSVINFFEANDTAYLIMLYLEGNNLQDFLKNRGGRLSETEAVPMITMVLDGLRAIHRANLLHRDIKPANIFLTKEGSIRLVDFGSARRAMGEHSATLSKIVSDGYSPFEQYTLAAKEGPWTDIYAVSATLHHLISGKRPPPASERIAEDRLRPLRELFGDEISQSISDAVAKGLALRPEERFQSVEHMLDALNSVKSYSTSSIKDFVSRNVSGEFHNTTSDAVGIIDNSSPEDSLIGNPKAEQKVFGDESGKLMESGSSPGFQKHEASEAKSQQGKRDAKGKSPGISGRKCVTIGDIDQNSMKRLPRHVLEKYKIIPMGSTGNLMKLAMANPDNLVALDDVKFIAGVSNIEIVPATEESILSTLHNYYKHSTPVAEPPKKHKPNVIRSGSAKLPKRKSRWKKPLGWSLAGLVLIIGIAIIASYGTDKKIPEIQPKFQSQSNVKLPSKKPDLQKPAAPNKANGKTESKFNVDKGKFSSGKVSVPGSDKATACAKAESAIIQYTNILCRGYSAGKCVCEINTENTGKWKCSQDWKCNVCAELSKQEISKLSNLIFPKK